MHRGEEKTQLSYSTLMKRAIEEQEGKRKPIVSNSTVRSEEITETNEAAESHLQFLTVAKVMMCTSDVQLPCTSSVP